ncbi:MAG: hypothetical protein LBG76_02980 [Treponema sp.]|jgi:hypothetical protein|nr:hypothetical protein [Treponema sp.]
MRYRYLGFLTVGLFFFGEIFPVYAGGKIEETPETPLNAEWVFCVTAFDVSALPPSRQLIGEVMAANLVQSLGKVERRVRVSPEYAYYEGVAMSKARLDAGKKLQAKRDERDMLVFSGNPDWKYRRDRAALDQEILKLEEAYRKAESAVPPIETKPVFTPAAANREGKYPPAPAEGGEYYFCAAQKADAFLTAEVSEFHGRVYLTLRIYNLYTRSYRYEDSTIFSLDDIIPAMDELAERITAVVAGSLPAAVLVHAVPEDSLVLINRDFAGRGETGIVERSSGEVEIAVSAPDHRSVTVPLELAGGELTEIFVNLEPLPKNSFTVDIPGKPGSILYRGSLYAGETPFSLDLLHGEAEYIDVRTPDGETGGAIIRSGETRPQITMTVSMPTGEKEVTRFRRGFYGAYGRFWLALPVAFLVNGIYTLYRDTYVRPEALPTLELYNRAVTLYYVNMGATALAAGFLAESLFRMYRYAYISGKNQPNIAK